MKQTKVMMFLAFIFCVTFSTFSMSASAAVQTVRSMDATAQNEAVAQKSLKKQLRKQWKKVLTKVKEVKKTLKEKAENISVSNGQLLSLALVGLACIGLGVILTSSFITSLGGLFITIAIVLWVLKLIGIV